MKTRELQILWWDWLSTAERLLRSLKEQTAALTLRDVERIEKLQPELDRLLAHMRTLDEEAVVSATSLAEKLGCEPAFRSIVGALDKPEAQQIQTLASRVRAVAKNVQETMARNKVLIENELTYINGTMTLISRAAQEDQRTYSKQGQSTALVNQVA